LVDAFIREVQALGGEQAVVYCETLQILDQAAKRLTELGITFAHIQGDDTPKKRAAAVQAHRDGEVQILLGSNVVERGLNLQRCRRLISLDSSWNPGRENQREGRLCRIGSAHETYEHVILLPDTGLVHAKQGILDRKRAMAEAVGL
jgi:SNF2 family DNA or RNA helicase